ncbi:MAG: transcriptional activator NhaR [Planctomycetes bacterium]|nr:transcriptional activator NhaR [Planctomycetota bacterium]
MSTALHWLNYHHLLYFWTVAREGGVARAAERLHLTHPTVSGQVRELEQALGEKLFVRAGRGLELTEMGRVVYRYADEIFALGRELVDTVKGRPTGRPVRLVVGVDDVLPKLLVRRLLEPALRGPEPVHLVVHEAPVRELFGRLAQHALDVVLSDSPMLPGTRVKAYAHLLGECSVTWFAVESIQKRARRDFPRSLSSEPLLLPTEDTALRHALDPWFERQGIRPRIAAEIADSALMKAFGQNGHGIFPAPTAVERDVQREYGVRVVGRSKDLRERFWAISVERRIKNPAVAAISAVARDQLFAEP